MERDDDVRAACIAALQVLRAEFGDEIPYRGALSRNFPFRGTRLALRFDRFVARGG